jgi:uncharacterized protein (DUF2267 family)
MDELVKQITGRANISEAQARKAVDTVLSFVKKRLPAPVVDQIENALEGGSGGGSAGFGEITKGIGDLLDKD